jgi:hypothetical protein
MTAVCAGRGEGGYDEGCDMPDVELMTEVIRATTYLLLGLGAVCSRQFCLARPSW